MIFAVYGMLLLALVIAGAIHGTIVRREERQRLIFRHIGLVVRQNIPLSVGLFCAALSERGPTRRVLSRLSLFMETGIALSDALRMAWPACPAAMVTMVRAAEASGTLPDALAELNARLLAGREMRRANQAHRWFYLGMLIACFFILAIFGVPYFIVPRFQTIFLDFNAPLGNEYLELLSYIPVVTPWPMGPTARLYAAALCAASALLVVMLIGWPFVRTLRRSLRPNVLTDALETTAWFVWPIRTLERLRCMVRSLPTLRLALAAGRPLHEAAALAADVRTNAVWQRRLTNWAAELQAGGDAGSAARNAGMPSLLCQYLSAGARDGDFDAPLYSAEQYFAALEQRWQRILHEFLWPLALLLVAAVFGLFSWAMISVMNQLLERVLASME